MELPPTLILNLVLLIVPHLQQTKKGLNFMSILQTIDLKKYYGTEPDITHNKW